MKKIFLGIIVFTLFVMGAFAYSPSSELTEKMDNVVVTLTENMKERGVEYQESIFAALDAYRLKYSNDERALYVIEYIENALKESYLYSPESNKTRPNILLIIADDMGIDAAPGYSEGSVKPDMPHLESMIESGLVFENVWAAPVCTPTRSTIMTGKYVYHTGMHEVGNTLSTDEIGIQKYLDIHTDNTYDHAVIGKWHIGNTAEHPIEMGVDYYAGLLNGGVKDYSSWRFTENGNTSMTSEYITSLITDTSISWLNDRRDETPWFLWAAYTAPHTPFHLPPAELHNQYHLSGTQEDIEQNPQDYYMAMLESLDTEIGRLLENIPQDDLENTVIIFLGDNGSPAKVAQYPFERKKAKGSLYQGGINVPMVISGYGVSRQGQREDMLINTTDLYATIADIAGTDTGDIHNSVSFAQSFYGEVEDTRDYVYSEDDSGYTIRDESFKLIIIGEKQELYDLQNDPYETTNLLKRGASSAALAAKEELENYLSEIRTQ